MAIPSIKKLSYQELLELQRNVAVALEERKAEEKAAVKEQIAQLAASAGFDFDELVGKRRGARKGSKVAVKFRHSKDPTLTWTGRGRQPKWLAAELKKGKKLAAFEI